MRYYRFFRNFKQVIRSEHGRGANQFINIVEYEGVSCYTPSVNAYFLKCNNFFSRKTLAWCNSNSNNHVKREQML